MSDIDMMQAAIDEDPALRGWEVVSDVSICCAEHGYDIEWDGVCPEGCVSAIRQMGWI